MSKKKAKGKNMDGLKDKDEVHTDWVNLRKENIVRVSANVSNILRQFILAGVGIVWLFKVVGKDGYFQLDSNLLVALGAFVLAILSELLHYILEIILNAFYLTDKRKDKEMPTYLSSISWLFWIGKIVLVLLAYVLIGRFLCGKIIL